MTQYASIITLKIGVRTRRRSNMGKKNKTDLYEMHEDIAAYFKSILTLHATMLKSVQDKVDKGDIDDVDFLIHAKAIQLAPALLTVITSFLKTNEIVVLPENMGEELTAYEKECAKFKESTSVSKLDVTLDVN